MRLLRPLLLVTGLLGLLSCGGASRSGVDAEPARPVRVLLAYTNDEHGWIEGMKAGHGAAELAGLLATESSGHDELLLLSGGDNWTGPAISTWFEGRSAVEAMNAMGYRASAVGNHEFDFGLAVLRERAAEASFPYLAANVRWRESGEPPTELGIRSHVLLELGAVRLGVIGLVTTTTPRVTVPSHVAELEFLPLESALREAAAIARTQGATELVVIAHACVTAVRALAEATADLDIAFYGAGHCNESHVERLGESLLLSTSGHFRQVGLVDLVFDSRSGRLSELGAARIVDNADGQAVPEIEEIVVRWRERTDEQLGTVIGRLDAELGRRSRELEQLIVSSWLESIESADVALMNRGGVRASLPAGDVTIADVVAVLPFANTIVESSLTGAQLAEGIRQHAPIVGGMEWRDGSWVLANGDPLEPERSYRVLSNNFCYAGGDGWTFLAEADPEGYDTGIHFRQPLLDHFTR